MRKYTKLRLDEVNLSDHADLIKYAEDGCILCMQWLMADAATLLQHGVALPEPLGSFIGEAIYKSTYEPEKITENFHLKRNRGRNKYTEISKKHLICMEVRFKRFYLDTNEKAYEEVANEYGYKDAESIGNIYKKRYSDWKLDNISKTELYDQLKFHRRMYKELFNKKA